MPDHVHMLISIPPKYAVSHVVGCIKGKSAIYLAKTYGERQRNFTGYSFGPRSAEAARPPRIRTGHPYHEKSQRDCITLDRTRISAAP